MAGRPSGRPPSSRQLGLNPRELGTDPRTIREYGVPYVVRFGDVTVLVPRRAAGRVAAMGATSFGERVISALRDLGAFDRVDGRG